MLVRHFLKCFLYACVYFLFPSEAISTIFLDSTLPNLCFSLSDSFHSHTGVGREQDEVGDGD